MDLLKASGNTNKAIRTGPKSNSKRYGVGLTELRKLARTIGKDHALALELWKSDIYEARILGLLIDDPKLITREQAEEQVEDLNEPVLAHVFSSCDASLAKVPFIVELATDWIDSKDKTRRSCGYGLLSEIASSKK
jgi:3-methyladenine DNA glycosylase AlkD